MGWPGLKIVKSHDQPGLGIPKLSHNKVPNRPNKSLAYAGFRVPITNMFFENDGCQKVRTLLFIFANLV